MYSVRSFGTRECTACGRLVPVNVQRAVVCPGSCTGSSSRRWGGGTWRPWPRGGRSSPSTTSSCRSTSSVRASPSSSSASCTPTPAISTSHRSEVTVLVAPFEGLLFFLGVLPLLSLLLLLMLLFLVSLFLLLSSSSTSSSSSSTYCYCCYWWCWNYFSFNLVLHNWCNKVHVIYKYST